MTACRSDPAEVRATVAARCFAEADAATNRWHSRIAESQRARATRAWLSPYARAWGARNQRTELPSSAEPVEDEALPPARSVAVTR